MQLVRTGTKWWMRIGVGAEGSWNRNSVDWVGAGTCTVPAGCCSVASCRLWWAVEVWAWSVSVECGHYWRGLGLREDLRTGPQCEVQVWTRR